jgi:cholest-4-en-3-one 26-monooxygenase
MLRFRPPARFFRRTAARDTRLGGRRIREGERVTLWFPSANRDEAIFERPDDFDPTRAPNPHLAFGAGHHMCLGAHLARLQMQVVFAGLLRRFERIELAGPVRRQCTSLMDGVAALPVRALPAC